MLHYIETRLQLVVEVRDYLTGGHRPNDVELIDSAKRESALKVFSLERKLELQKKQAR